MLVKERSERSCRSRPTNGPRRSASSTPSSELRSDARTRLGLVGKVQAQMLVREKVLEAAAGLVRRRPPRGAHRPGSRAAAARPGTDRLEEQARRSPKITSRRPARNSNRSSTACSEGSGRRRTRRPGAAGGRGAGEFRSTEEEIGAKIGRLAERLEQKAEKVRRDLERRGVVEAVRSDIARGQALEFPRRPCRCGRRGGEPLIDLTLPDGRPPRRSPPPDAARCRRRRGAKSTKETPEAGPSRACNQSCRPWSSRRAGANGIRLVLAAAEGAHHLPRDADRRHRRQPVDGAAD